MKFSTLRALFAARYERLFVERFKLESGRDIDDRASEDLPRRRRFSVAGAIFPTESTLLPRYQY